MIDVNLTKITLVIPTYERPTFALRNMKYWSNKGVCVRVVDGSKCPIEEGLLKSFGNNIIYKHDPRSSNERIASIIPEIDTKYTALMGDDEFYISSALSSCIEELENDILLTSCFGRCIWFNASGDALKVYDAYQGMRNYSVQHNSPDDRVLYHMKNYQPSMIYSVMRTDVWKKSISCMDNEQYQVFALEELQFEIASSYLGKSKVLPVLLWMRSGENTGVDNKGEVVKIHSWWKDSFNNELREKMLNNLTISIVTNHNKANKIHVKALIVKAFELFISREKVRLPIKSMIIFQIARLLSMLPKAIKNVIKKQSHEAYYNLQNFKKIDSIAKKFEIEGVYVDLKELKNIENLIINFHDSLSVQDHK